MARTNTNYESNLLSDFQKSKVVHQAQNYLIARKKCSKVRTDFYTHICYGEDRNTLDYSRQWLYKELLAEGESPERARIAANKLVLYVNEDELQKVTDEFIEEMIAEQKKKAEEKAKSAAVAQ